MRNSRRMNTYKIIGLGAVQNERWQDQLEAVEKQSPQGPTNGVGALGYKSRAPGKRERALGYKTT